MNRRIILHIGSPKCGSTYLQRAMLQNAALLMANGVYYPTGDDNHPGNGMIVPEVTQEQFDGLFSKPNIHTTILSHENLYARPEWGTKLSEMVKGTDITVQVVVFLRPFSGFLYGDYSQFMKQFFDTYLETRKPYDNKTFETFAERRISTLKPAGFLPKWAERFPQAPLLLASHRDIQSTLEALIGTIDGMNWAIPSELTNPSLRVSDCDAISDAMRDLSVSSDDLRKMLHAAFHATGLPDEGRTAERTQWIEEQFEPQNNALFDLFGFNNRAT